VSLEPSRVALGPGDSAAVTVSISNTGDVVEHYGVQVLGLPPGQVWEAGAPLTKLQPGESGRVVLRIELSEQAPPAAATLVLGVLVRSPYRPEVSRAEELRLDVRPAPGLSASAEPEVVTGSRGDYRITLRNDGNTGLDIVLKGNDPENAVRLSFSPQRLTLMPGGSAVSDLTASASRPLTGREVQRRIAVVAQAGAHQETVDLTLVQRPRIAGTAMRVAAATGGLLVAVGTMFGATLLLTNAIAGAGDTQNTSASAKDAGQVPAPGPAVPSASTGPPVTVSVAVTTPPASTGPPPSAVPGTTSPPADGSPAAPLDLDLTAAPQDGRTGWRVIDADSYSGVLLASQPPKQQNPACANETRVQYVQSPSGSTFVSSGSVDGVAGAQNGRCMDMPVLISFRQPVTSVSVTVLPTLATGVTGASATYGILPAGGTTPAMVSGAPGRPLQLTWNDPDGLTEVKVGGYPGYQGTITAIQRITAR
jgi:hypothetical protein